MKVALVGSASGWAQALELDPTWEVWGLNDQYLLGPQVVARATRWFELHGDTPLTRARRPADHWDRLAAFTIPIYTLFTLPGVVTARVYPLADAAGIRDYFACTFAYQIALALLEGVTDLHLYGTPLTGAREALVERPCVEWWCGYAEGHGVSVQIHHAEPWGLGRQQYRYAAEDQLERRLAYSATLAHQASADFWLPREQDRLILHETDLLAILAPGLETHDG